MQNKFSLNRDPEYLKANIRLVELQTELIKLEKERDAVTGQLNELSNGKQQHKSKLDVAAEALLNGIKGKSSSGVDSIRKTYSELTDAIRIHRRAIDLQRNHLNKLKSKVSREIAKEIQPEHIKNVKAIASALIKLEQALVAEHSLRENLIANEVELSDIIRPMPLHGIGMLSDPQSRISRYMLECFEYGFISKNELPDCLHSHIPSKGEPAKHKGNNEVKLSGWLSLN